MSPGPPLTPNARPVVVVSRPLTDAERERMRDDAIARHRQALLEAACGHGTIGGHNPRAAYREAVQRLLAELAEEVARG